MLSNGTIFNDLEWPLTQISKSRYYSTSNNPQIVQNRSNQQKVVSDLSNSAIFSNLERPPNPGSRSRYNLTLDVSETAKDTATVAAKGE